MSFFKPEFLYGLLALLIPLLVHLFQWRRFQNQDFTNVAFLRQLKLQSRKSQIVKKWLVLLLRMLAVASIILAFSQPYIPKSTQRNTPPELVIYLDNSNSMQAKNNNGPLLKSAIQELLEQDYNSTKISLFTNSNTYRQKSLEDLQDELQKIDYSYNQLKIQDVISKSKLLFSKTENCKKYLFLISDFQHSSADLHSINMDSSLTVFVVPKSPLSAKNAFIDRVILTPSLQNYKLELYGKTTTDSQDSIGVSLLNNNQLIGKSILTKAKNFKASFLLPTNSIINGKILLDDAGPNFDNTFFFNIPKVKKIKVMEIGNIESDYLKKIYTSDEFSFRYVSPNQLNYNSIEQQDLIIVNELNRIPMALANQLQNFENSGGTLVFIPSFKGDIESYNYLLGPYDLAFKTQFLEPKKITSINYDHPIYASSFEGKVKNFKYPEVQQSYILKKAPEHLLEYEDGHPFLAQQSRIYVFTSAITQNHSNFSNSPLIVPTLYGIGKSSFKTPPLYYTLGQTNTLDLDYKLSNDDVFRLSNGKDNFIPKQVQSNSKLQMEFTDLPTKSGHYSLSIQSDTLQKLSFNYSNSESQINLIESDQIKRHLKSNGAIKSISAAFESVKSEVDIEGLWKWFVIFAAIFLVLEMLVLKFFR